MGSKLGKLAPIAIVLGLLAFLVVLIADYVVPQGGPILPGLAWISFIGWPTYLKSGASLQGGIKNIVSYIIGIISAIIIFILGINVLGGAGWAMGLAVGIVAALLFFFEAGPDIVTDVPAMFIAAAVTIGLHGRFENYPADYLPLGLTVFVYLLLGAVCGYVLIAFKTWWDAR